ncbi:MAG: LysM peptidoglycan-binding domain-containing protein, partial [Ferruginibacter sp.]
SLLVIANEHKMSLSKLMDINDLTEEGLLGKDQYVFLHKKEKKGETEFYILQPGETLYDAAQKNGIQLKYLLEYNNLQEGARIAANTKLFLQPDLASTTGNPEPAKKHVHVVAAKQGLYAIARMYNVTVQQLKTWNKLDSEELKIGQQIIVSK